MKFDKVTPIQAKHTGLAVILVLLLATYFNAKEVLLISAIGVLVPAMLWPTLFLHNL